jgi:uncharacterized membrane protein
MSDFVDIERAVAAGAITRRQAGKLRALGQSRDEIAREQRPGWLNQLAGSGHVLLQLLGILILFVIAMALLTLGMTLHTNPVIGFILTAALGWCASEWLVDRDARLIEGFAGIIWMKGMAGVYFYAVAVLFWPIDFKFSTLNPRDIPPMAATCCAIAMVMAAALHWWRFRVPVLILPATIAFAAIFGSIAQWGAPGAHLMFVSFLQTMLGVAALIAGFWVDALDVRRTGLAHRCGFWLHVLAAIYVPQGVIAMFALQVNGPELEVTAYAAVLILATAAGLMADRRIYVVAGLQAIIAACTVLLPGDRPTWFAVLTFYALMMLIDWSALRPLIVDTLPLWVRASLAREAEATA